MYNGDFSFGGQTTPSVLPIYNPYTTQLVGSTYVREPFPSNLVPKTLFDPAAAKFLGQNPFCHPTQGHSRARLVRQRTWA